MKAFEYDSGPMQFANLLIDLTILNIVWLLCCIPVITAGAATAALYSSAGKRMDGDRQVFKNYKAAFKRHFKQATVVWLIFFILTAAFYMAYSLLTTVDIPGNQILTVISVLAFVALLFVILWAYPVMTNYKGNIREILFNAFVFSFMYAPVSLIAIGVYALVFYLMLRFMSVRVLFFVFVPALVVYINMKLFKIVFKKYTSRQGIED